MKASEIKVLLELESGKTSEDLVRIIHRSKSFISVCLKNLKGKGLIKIEKKDGKIYYILADNSKAILVYKIAKKYPNLLKGKREILLKHLLKESDLKNLQISTNLSLKQIIEYLKELKSMGIVIEQNKKYYLNPKEEDIIQLVKLMNLKLTEIFWKKNKESLIMSHEVIDAAPTAFSVFDNFGIKIFSPINYYYLPKRKLGKEEVFVHSLVFSKTKQENLLVAIFYLKHTDMDKEKLFLLAKKFNVSKKLYDLVKFINGKPSDFGNFADLMEKAKEYEILLERKFSSKEDILRLFSEIDNLTPKKVNLYVFGGANMVIRGMKISTKDIDIIVKGKDYEILEDVLKLLGFKFSNNIFKRRDYRIDLFKDRVLKGYFLTEKMIKNSELFFNGKKLFVYLLKPEYVFLFKSYAGRDIDIDDCGILAKHGLDWKIILEEVISQQARMKKVIGLTLLDILDELKNRFNISSPITRKLDIIVLERLINLTLVKPMSVKNLVEKLEKPEPTIRKVLSKLLKKKIVRRFKKERSYYYVLRHSKF